MQGYAIDRGRIYHHRQRTGESCSLEGLEIFLADHQRVEIGWCTILTSPGGTIGKVVLRAGTYVILVDMIVVITLITSDLCHHHLSVYNGILTETLIHTRPARIATQIHHRVKHPGTVGCTTLISRNLRTSTSQFWIKRSTEVDRLREKGSTLRISHTVVVIQTIDIRDAQILHRLLLNLRDPLLPLLHRSGTGTWGIQDRAHLPLRDQCIEHHLIDLPETTGFTLIDIHREGTQQVDDLLISLTQHIVYLCLRSAILLQDRTHFLTIHLGILDSHLAHHVKIQLQHLTDLLIECHLGQCLLYFCFQSRITGDGRLRNLCLNSHSSTDRNDS